MAPPVYIHSAILFIIGLGMSRGDQILEVDSFSLRHAALSEAYAILSECGPGLVSLIVSRHPNPKVSEKEMDRIIARSICRDEMSKNSSHSKAFTPSVTEVESGPTYNASQAKTPVLVNHHVEAVCQPIAVSIPTSLWNPLLILPQVMCFENELGDDEDSDNAGLTWLFQTPTKPDSSHAQAFQISQIDSSVVIPTSLLNSDGDKEVVGDLKRSGINDLTTPLYDSFSMGSIAKESESPESESPGSESPFMPICCPLDHKTRMGSSMGSGCSNLTIKNVNYTGQDDGQLELKHSSKLEHKAVMQVKTLLSTEAPNLPQQKMSKGVEPPPGLAPSQLPSDVLQCGRNPRIADGLIPSQECKKRDASELVGVCTIDTVTLWKNEDESFGLDLEIMSSPLKVVITGLTSGGVAERESTGKLCPGDEIVKIGEKVVSSFSYREICELMHNLPSTLSLVVKRPVSDLGKWFGPRPQEAPKQDDEHLKPLLADCRTLERRGLSVPQGSLGLTSLPPGDSGTKSNADNRLKSYFMDSLKELATSPVSQCKLQTVLSALLQETKALSEVNTNICLVVLSKEEGLGLGFSIAGGADLEQKAITAVMFPVTLTLNGVVSTQLPGQTLDDVHTKHAKTVVEAHCFSNSRDAQNLWQGIQTITDYKPPLQTCDSITSPLDELNDFFAHFEARNSKPAQKSSQGEGSLICGSSSGVFRLFSMNNRKYHNQLVVIPPDYT
ncbi:hypothetical protein L3Q82_006676 [Scortum barcoo]|uniref:Uncharacterized protein n=1 Tax=Scortum barcoo TaxID=214431 RepID=A0ACB8WVH2_9TELE|nr:hypothetical protein L3Q82_006676 [Scortum barcoo]